MAQDLTGMTFFRLTVVGLDSVKQVGKKRPRPEYMWRCRCLCGNERVVCSGHLRSGHNKSCGCWSTDRKRLSNPQQSQINVAYAQHKHAAKIRGLSSELTEEMWFQLVQQPCYYCGVTNSCEKKPDRRQQYGESFFCNGVDRVDNQMGYTEKNSVSCCQKCNFMKWKLDANTFVSQCRRISEYVSNIK